VLCSSFVQFILRADRARRFRFVGAQSALGAALYRHYGLPSVAYTTNILLAGGQAFINAEGSIRVFEALGFPYRLMAVGRLLPRPVRDALYKIVARNRFTWFGARQTCYRPQAADAGRFLG
jgi:predicted DCC family thiol-disulfide oxidoreductase YuxK